MVPNFESGTFSHLTNKYSSIWNGLNRPRWMYPRFYLFFLSEIFTSSFILASSVRNGVTTRHRPSRNFTVLLFILSIFSEYTIGSIQPGLPLPSTHRVQEGDSVILSCNLIDSFKFSSLSWSLNGRTLVARQSTYTTNWSSGKGELKPDDSLLIFSAQVEDSGEYACVGSEGKKTKNATQVLVVEVGKPILQHADTNVVLNEGNRLMLNCSGLLPLEWQYPKQEDKHVLITSQLNPPIRGSHISSTWREISVLTIENLTIKDSGEYRCSHRGTHDFAEEKWSATRIFVMQENNGVFLPHIDEPITVFPGQPFIIPCRSFPNYSITLRPGEVFYNNRDERIARRAYLNALPYSHHVGFSIDSYQLWFGDRVKCFSQEETQYFNLTVVDSPTIDVESEKILNEGESLQLSCKGSLRILWSFPVVGNVPIPKLRSSVESGTGLIRSNLSLESVTSSNSGRYSCFYNRFKSELSDELQTSTYIYVTSNDKNEDFLPINFGEETVHIPEDAKDSFVIPCRVNNPNTSVTLELCYRYDRQCPDTLLNGYNHSYEPKSGFHLTRNVVPQEIPSNLQAYCSTDHDAQNFYLFFEGGENNSLNIEVTATASDVFANEAELNITCKVDILKLLLWDRTLRPQLEWEFDKASNTYIIEEDEDDGKADNPRFTYSSYLIISNVTTGTRHLTYICRATNSMFKEQESVTVNVYDKAFITIINRNEDNQTSFQLLEDQSLCLSVMVLSFPKVDIQWWYDGIILAPSNDISLSDTDGHYNRTCTLCFNALRGSMGGDYVINVTNSYGEDSTTFKLDVLVPPTVDIEYEGGVVITPYEGASPLYEDNSEVVFNCSAKGIPTPMVHWEYSECGTVETDKCLPEGHETRRFRKGDLDIPSYIFSDGEPSSGSKELSLQAKVSAIFRCVATADSPLFDKPVVESSVRFLVTSERDPFKFTVPRGVYVGQPADMDCIVNGYSFMEAVIGVRENGTNKIVSSDNKAALGVKNFITLQDSSRKRTVRIEQVTLEDAGTYYCEATPINDGAPLVKEVQFNVQEVVPVSIHCSNDNITHDVNGNDVTISCVVSGDPKPIAELVFPSQTSLNKDLNDVSSNFTFVMVNFTIPTSYMSVVEQREVLVIGKNLGSKKIAEITLIGVESPRIQAAEDGASFEAEVGQNFSLSCFATGSPQPLIGWKKMSLSNQVSQIESSRMTILDGVLTIYNAEERDAGVYVCTASNKYGYDEKLHNITILPADSQEEGFHRAYIILILSAVAAFILICFVCISQRGNPKDHPLFTLSELNEFNRGGLYPLHMQGMMPEEIYERLPYDPRWEFNRERLILGPIIGRGAFGMVIKAKAVGIESPNSSTIVAVKTLKDEASDTEKKALWAELKLLAHVGRHLNVVNFLGACTTGSPLLLIVEFCTYGNLSDYLRKRRRVFYGSRDNTGSDSSQMSTTPSFPNLSNESHLRTVRESRNESRHSYNHSSTGGTCDSTTSYNQSSTGGTFDSAIGHSTTDSPLFTKSGVALSTGPTNSPSSLGIKSRSSIDLTNCGELSPGRKPSEKSNESEQENIRNKKRLGISLASSMGSLNRNLVNHAKHTKSPPSSHTPLTFNDSISSAFELPLREEDLICYAFQTARGMEFLSSKQVIHRDLAARNVLLTDSNVVKICDFGLARHLYHNPDYIASGKGRFPVKWMAPESIFDKVYTTQTDIWSFGVLLWEIFSLGGSPYPGIQMDENFYTKLKEGYRMSPPEIALPEIGDIMHECWNENPKDRPPFSELENRLGDLLAANTRMEYVEMNNPYEDMTAELEAQQQEHLKETSLLLPANSFESLCSEPPMTPSDTESGTESGMEPPSLSDLHQTTIV